MLFWKWWFSIAPSTNTVRCSRSPFVSVNVQRKWKKYTSDDRRPPKSFVRTCVTSFRRAPTLCYYIAIFYLPYVYIYILLLLYKIERAMRVSVILNFFFPFCETHFSPFWSKTSLWCDSLDIYDENATNTIIIIVITDIRKSIIYRNSRI